jgi:parallel beta-helix repeat protein
MKFGRRGSMLCAAAALLGSVGAAALVSVAPAGAVTGPSLYVATTGNDSNNTCRLAAHPCATISHAVSQAPAGSSISVGAGTYTTPLTLTNSMNITGAVQNGANATVLNPSTTVADADSTYENATPQTIGALVDVTNGASVNFTNLVINGAAASPSFTPTACQDDFVGIYFHNASGSVNNVNVKGVELAPALFGCQDGLAVYAATDAASPTGSTVVMSGVAVKTYDKNGITCSDPQTSCTVTNSTVAGIGPTGAIAQNGIQISYGAAGAVSGTKVTGNSYTGGGADNQATGILVYDAAAVNLNGNTLSANDVDLFAGADSGAASGHWTIVSNTVSGATDNVPNGTPGNGEGNGYGDGIQLDGVGSANPTTVNGNTATGNFEYGIAVYSSAHMSVINNHANSNFDGIYIDSGSGANGVQSNVAKANGRYDYEDLSSGGGTSGTADTWVTNTCKPLLDSSPEGLC